MEVRGSGNFELFARSGNVDNPDRNWSPWKKVDLRKDLPVGCALRRASCSGRRCCIPGTQLPVIDSVTLNYLPKNVAPEVDDVTCHGGCAHSCRHAHRAAQTSDAKLMTRRFPTVPDKHSIAVKWKAHDENDD